jgi:hypothetical protein
MKFRANEVSQLFVVAAIVITGFSLVVGQANVCNCPKPPGGEAHCEPNQVAFCSVRNGQSVARCITTSTTMGKNSFPQVRAETLSYLFDVKVEPSDVQLNLLYALIIKSQGFRTSDTVVTFSIPNDPEVTDITPTDNLPIIQFNEKTPYDEKTKHSITSFADCTQPTPDREIPLVTHRQTCSRLRRS